MRRRLLACVDRHVPHELLSADPDTARRGRLVVVLAVLFGMWGPIYGLIMWLGLDMPLSGCVAIVQGVFVMAGGVLLHRTRSLVLTGNWIAGHAWLAVVIICLTTGGVESATLVWFAPTIVVAALLAGRNAAFAWLFATLLVTTSMWLLQLLEVSLPTEVDPALRGAMHWFMMLGSMTAIYFFAWQFELAKDEMLTEVDDARRGAEQAHAEARLLLDNMSDCLLVVGPSGVVGKERSARASELLGDRIAPLWDVLADLDRSLGPAIEAQWENLVSGGLPPELCLEQMPCEAVSHDRHYELSYQFFDATADAGMLVMIRDVTEAAARERAEENTRELRAILGHITRDRRGFIAFVRECERLIAQIDDGSATREVQLRDLHTLKGICAQFSMHSIAKACHLAEDAALAERAVRGAQWEDVRSRWRTMIDAVGPFRGLDGGESLEIPADEICVALAEAEAHDMAQPVVDRLRRWQLEPATIPLAGIGEWGRQLALRLDKGSIAVRVDAADCWLPRNALRPLWASLIHVVRNAIDHGLERPDERGAKPPVGVLSLRAERVDGKVRIEVSDDGRGVDWGRLRAAARARGLPAATHDDLVGALFSDGVSTAAQTTLISGRGVGMASVRATIEALGGRIEVLSVAGRETRFSFELDEAQLMLAERVPPGSPSDAASTLRVA